MNTRVVVLFSESFATPSGRARLAAVDCTPSAELTDEVYPYVLITGRLLEHWRTGALSRRSEVLDKLEPVPTASLHSEELRTLGLAEGEPLTLESRRGRITALARGDDSVPKGTVFMSFVYAEAAANQLTNDALDPISKIPEYKYCAIRIRPGGELSPTPSYSAAAVSAACPFPILPDVGGQQNP
jgi:formate dehydrogenase major subunit